MIQSRDGLCLTCRPLLERLGRVVHLARKQAFSLHQIGRHPGPWYCCTHAICLEASELLSASGQGERRFGRNT